MDCSMALLFFGLVEIELQDKCLLSFPGKEDTVASLAGRHYVLVISVLAQHF